MHVAAAFFLPAAPRRAAPSLKSMQIFHEARSISLFLPLSPSLFLLSLRRSATLREKKAHSLLLPSLSLSLHPRRPSTLLPVAIVAPFFHSVDVARRGGT